MNHSTRVCISAVCCLLTMVLFSWPIRGDTGDAHPRPFDIQGPRSTKLLGFQPALDILVVVDNSGSMSPVILSLEDELFDHLVGPLIAFGIDIRVVVISRHGDNSSQSICFEEPLSNVPVGGCSNPPGLPGITDDFKHYSVEVSSHNAWCLLMSTFDGTTPDEFGLAPTGWVDWLRDGALRLILVVTDDGVTCGAYDDGDSIPGGLAAATAIDSDLLALSPLHFGSMAHRKYIVHSLVGLEAFAVPSEPWPPSAPVTVTECVPAVSAGTGHQTMSVLTRGLRFSVCMTTEFDLFLEAVEQDTTRRTTFFADGFETGDTSWWSSTNP